MPKLSAEQTTASDQIIRVEITAQMLNELNEDGSLKFPDEQLREWLHKLRGDREEAIAKKVAKESGTPRAPKASSGLTEDDLT